MYIRQHKLWIFKVFEQNYEIKVSTSVENVKSLQFQLLHPPSQVVVSIGHNKKLCPKFCSIFPEYL